ncbi:MAG: 26S proteasome non-ATPase regulatory subunit 10, partial [Paramarteilia canceri]
MSGLPENFWRDLPQDSSGWSDFFSQNHLQTLEEFADWTLKKEPSSGRLLLHFMAVSASSTHFKQLSKFNKNLNLDEPDSLGWTALMIASSSDNLQVVQYLIEQGCDLNRHCKPGDQSSPTA